MGLCVSIKKVKKSTLGNLRLVSTKDLDLHCDGFAVLGKILRETQGLHVIDRDSLHYMVFKSKKHASPNNTQLVSMEGVFVQT